MKIILTPYDVRNNNYIEIHKNFFKKLGYTVVPISLKNILSLWATRHENIYVANWIEDKTSGFGFGLLAGFITTCAKILYGKFVAKKFIWIRHNLKPHADNKTSRFYKIVIEILYKVSDVKITHGPYILNEGYKYVPHPLYCEFLLGNNTKSIDYLFFGHISRYKGLLELLKSWPSDKNLVVYGKCNDVNLKKDINNIIKNKKLSVKINYEFLEEKKLNILLKKTKFVLLPHQDGAMIVSGSFYHAISYGANIIAKQSKFSESMSKKFDFVSIYNDENSLGQLLNEINYLDEQQVFDKAKKEFGEKNCINSWSNIFLQL